MGGLRDSRTGMGYLPGKAGLGDVASIASVAQAALKVSEDLYLPEVTCQVLRLSAMEEGKDPGPPCGKLSLKIAPGRGIGLRHVVVPIRLIVKAKERPLVAAAIAGAAIFSLFALGVAVGRQRRPATP